MDFRLKERITILHKLSDIMDCSKININELSQMAFDDPSTNGNPRQVNKEDLKLIYEHSISGDLF